MLLLDFSFPDFIPVNQGLFAQVCMVVVEGKHIWYRVCGETSEFRCCCKAVRVDRKWSWCGGEAFRRLRFSVFRMIDTWCLEKLPKRRVDDDIAETASVFLPDLIVTVFGPLPFSPISNCKKALWVLCKKSSIDKKKNTTYTLWSIFCF